MALSATFTRLPNPLATRDTVRTPDAPSRTGEGPSGPGNPAAYAVPTAASFLRHRYRRKHSHHAPTVLAAAMTSSGYSRTRGKPRDDEELRLRLNSLAQACELSSRRQSLGRMLCLRYLHYLTSLTSGVSVGATLIVS